MASPPLALSGDGPGPIATRRRGAELARVLAIAAGVGTVLSLQFFTQPFVWRNFPLDEVFIGWLYVLRDSTANALGIAGMILVATRIPVRSGAARLALIGVAAFLGAAAAEGLVRLLAHDTTPLDSLVGSALRWAVLSVAVAMVIAFWRRARAAREQLRQETARRVEFETELTRARLGALQSQIEPHLLFNTLGAVRQLHRVDPAPGDRLLGQFLDYLQRMLSMHERTVVPLVEELDLVRSYLLLLQSRLPGRLEVEIDVEGAPREAQIPPWSISTLVENAVKHGLGPLLRPGRIAIRAAAAGEMLEVTVVDDGVGLGQGSVGGAGIGLSNVRSRLAALYGARGSLQVASPPEGGVCARLTLPVRWAAPGAA